LEETTKILIDVRIESADEDLETAKELLKLNRYRAAVNRAYYAIFSTTNAVLLSKQIERSKHSGVEAAFIQNFIKTGVFRNYIVRFPLFMPNIPYSSLCARHSLLFLTLVTIHSSLVTIFYS
jgi:uncharacterized protein (UPF0332 family)